MVVTQNTKISKDNVIKKLRGEPQTFNELFTKFGISNDLAEGGSYSSEYLKLLDIVSRLETPINRSMNGKEILPIVVCAKEKNEQSYILYLGEEDEELMKLGKVRKINEPNMKEGMLSIHKEFAR